MAVRVKGERVSFGLGDECIVCGGRECSPAPSITPHAKYPFYPPHTRNQGQVPMASQQYFTVENRVFVNGNLLYRQGHRVTQETADSLGLEEGHGELRLTVDDDGNVTDTKERGRVETESHEGGYTLAQANSGADGGDTQPEGEASDVAPATGTPNVISSASLTSRREPDESTEPPPKNATKETWADFVGYKGDLADVTRDELIERYDNERNVLT